MRDSGSSHDDGYVGAVKGEHMVVDPNHGSTEIEEGTPLLKVKHESDKAEAPTRTKKNFFSDDLEKGFGTDEPVFSELLSPQKMRRAFIRKVYGILAAQLVLTSLVAYLFMYNPSVNFFVLEHSAAVMWPSFICTIGLIIGLHCYKNKHPTNYYLLFFFTLFEAFIIGLVCAAYERAGYGFLILEAASITGVIFMSLSAFTLYSGYDFSFMGMYLFACLVGFMFWGFFCSIFGFHLSYFYSLCGSLLFSAYIVFDTWKISKVYGYDDYVPAAIDLYLDIVNLFLYVLDLLGRRN